MKNKKHYKWIIGTLITSAVCPLFLLISEVKGLGINTIYGLRTYTIVQSTGNITTTDGLNGGSETGNVPVEVLGSRGLLQGSPIRLNKVVVNIPGDYGISSMKYNSYTFRIRFYQAPYNWNGNSLKPSWGNIGFYTLSYRIKQTQRSETIGCSLYYSDPATREYSCSFSLSDYNTIDYMTFIGGSDDSRWSIITQGGGLNPNAVLINFVDINADGSQDPMIAGQQTIINQNQTIIDQNQQMIDQWEEGEQKTEQTSQEGQANANQSQQTMEGASTNVIGVIGNVVGAFNTAPRNNCSLPMDLGNINFGNVDFCTGKPAVWQTMLGGAMSIVLVYAIYHIAKNVFNIFVSAMAFAQGSGKGTR